MTWRLIEADCIEAMQQMEDSSVDAIVTDPPYGLEFMGKEWDRLGDDAVSKSWDTRGRRDNVPSRSPDDAGGRHGVHYKRQNPRCRKCGRAIQGRDTAKGFRVCGCTNPEPYLPGVFPQRMQAWHHAWATEALRVLKPGGHLLAFGGTRTYHRLACAIEDAGFEIRDCLAWMYGSGFPKSLDVSKAIDKAAGAEREVIGDKLDRPGYHLHGHEDTGRFGHGIGGSTPETRAKAAELTTAATPDAEQWQGWGTALKPAFEPIVLARKPLVGTVASNVTTFGTGALNVDGCRINSGGDDDAEDDGGRGQGSGIGADSQGPLHQDVPGVRAGVLDDPVAPEDHVQRRVQARLDGGHSQSQLHDGRLSGDTVGLSDAEGSSEHVPPRASGRDGGDPGQAVAGDGTGSPRQRNQVGQPTGEPGTARDSGALADTSASARGAGETPSRERPPTSTPRGRDGEASAARRYADQGAVDLAATPGPRGGDPAGRWPANVILDPAAAALLDEQTGDLTRWFNKPRQGNGKTGAELFGNHAGNGAAPDLDSGGASRFFYVAKSASAERNRGLEHREAARFEVADHGMTLERWPDGSLQERKTPRQTTRNTHPTVKPVELMQWLCRLVTPPNGVVLDPFTGSGSTGIAALREGFSFIGIEREHEYVAIARDRIIGDAPLFNIAAEVVA